MGYFSYSLKKSAVDAYLDWLPNISSIYVDELHIALFSVLVTICIVCMHAYSHLVGYKCVQVGLQVCLCVEARV